MKILHANNSTYYSPLQNYTYLEEAKFGLNSSRLVESWWGGVCNTNSYHGEKINCFGGKGNEVFRLQTFTCCQSQRMLCIGKFLGLLGRCASIEI